jgi:hypothetical protein
MTNGDSPGNEDESYNHINLSQIAGSALALMAIKPPHSKGNLQTSRAQVSLTDIPATIGYFFSLNEKFDGRSVFEVDPDEVRERRFYFYEWQHEHWQSTYLPHIDEFVIKGSVFDTNSWQLDSTHFPPGRTK